MSEGMLGMLSLSEIQGPRDDLERKLAGPQGPMWLAALKHFLRRENPWVFPVWRTVALGTGPKTADGFRKALKQAGMKIGDWANDILGKPAFTAATEETTLDLVRVSVGELGFKKGATRAQIYERARDLGLDLCPAEVGPQLRLQFQDQPMNDWFVIGMEPITDSDGNLNVFNLARDGDGFWLDSRNGLPDFFWRADCRWVFVRRK